MPMNRALENNLCQQLKSLGGFEFQAAIVRFHQLVHGAAGFQDLRAVRDQGCDGIIGAEGQAIACYGPDETRFKRFEKKVRSDHQQYSVYWKALCPRWAVFINRDPSPDEIKLVKALQPDGELWGVSRLIALLCEKPHFKRVEFCRYLRIDDDLIGRDFLQPIMDDMIANNAPRDIDEYLREAPNIAAKILANYAPDEVEQELVNNTSTAEWQALALEILNGYDDVDLSRIKATVLHSYERTPSTARFSERVIALVDFFASRYNAGGDHGLHLAIKGFVLLLFAQCLFGHSPEGR